MKKPLVEFLAVLMTVAAATVGPLRAQSATQSFRTAHARLQIDGRGFITSLSAIRSGKEYSPAGHPSPLMSLHEHGKPNEQLVLPTVASFDPRRREFTLGYPTGATAIIKAETNENYFRFELASLSPRGDVDNIVWGPLRTTISKIIGDLIGVARDDDFAIGLWGLDDNTIAGPVIDGDCHGMGYYVHSPDPVKHPVPAKYKEGDWFNIGGDGVNDVAFYSRPEEYFQLVFGAGAKLEPEFGSTIAHHARDRRRSRTHYFSLLPGFDRSRPRHMVADPVDGVDFIGSAVALYACPDDQGLATIEKIILAEGLPHVVIDGKWIRDPAYNKPDIIWSGPHDKLVEYANALGLKACQDEGQGQYFVNRGDLWSGKRVAFADGRSMSYKEFTDQAKGVKYGLHTLCLFLQRDVSNDVTPTPSPRLQTICRVKLARDVSATDTEIVVVDPSFLAEKGTWPNGDDSNYLRIGGEVLRYDGVTAGAPFTLLGVKRGWTTTASAHKAGDELVKLQQNCYDGFAPDMSLALELADHYARVLAANGMEYIDFDGYESLMYQGHGYYAMKVFNRRLFDSYAKLTGGKALRVMGSCVFGGGWEFMSVCNVGVGDRMFDPVNNRWGVEGKDMRNALTASYFPATFGIQEWRGDWSLYDAENLQAKSIGWDATYALGLNQDVVEGGGEKDAIFKAFRAWEDARAANVFTAAMKEKLRDLDSKFHIERAGANAFTIYPVKEVRVHETAGGETKLISLGDPETARPPQFALQVDEAVNGGVITPPAGGRIQIDRKMEKGQFIIHRDGQTHLADRNRNKIADLAGSQPAAPPSTGMKLGVALATDAGSPARFTLTVWTFGKGETISASTEPDAAR